MIGPWNGRHGDADRLAELHRAVAPDLLNYFARRVRPVDDAADLLNETLIVTWRRLRSVPDDAEQARMWLFRTAANVLRNHLRGQRRRDAMADRLRTMIAIAVDEGFDNTRASRPRAASTTRSADLDERLDVRAAVAALVPEQRELVILVHWDGFTIAEAATIAGVRETTARGRYQRARLLLRAALDAAEPTSASARVGAAPTASERSAV